MKITITIEAIENWQVNVDETRKSVGGEGKRNGAV